jgi:hypothetical protein
MVDTTKFSGQRRRFGNAEIRIGLEREPFSGHTESMAGNAEGIHLVRVITDDRKHQLWAAACRREDAVDQVLNAVPEGWAATLLSNRLKPLEEECLNLKPGEVIELSK